MSKRKEWNFSTDGENNFNVVFVDNKYVSVNGGEEIKIQKIKAKESNMLEAVFDVDLGNGQIAKLCCLKKDVTLVYDGKNVETGAYYEITRIPKWAYVFVSLYVVNFFFILGGAMGICVGFICSMISSSIASNENKSMVARVISCIVLYVIVTLISYLLVVNIFN